jgi:RimJ/RimL family protein N-acetyltransferase
VNESFRTERLELVPFARVHLGFLHRLWTDPDVRRFLWDDRVIGREEAAAVVESSLDSFRKHGFGMWLLLLEPDRVPIGFCGLRHFGEPRADVEILYGLLPSHWGRGLATDAACAVLECAFRTGLPRVFAGADPANAASIRVIKRIGMRLDGNRTIEGRDAPYYAIGTASFGARTSANRMGKLQ